MRTFVVGAVLLLLLGSSPAQALKRTRVGQPVGDFTLPSVAGEPIALSEHLGRKATLVVFWAQWSPRSEEALADYQELFAAYGPEDLAVVAVNVEHQAREAGAAEGLAAWVRARGLTFPVLIDERLSVFDRYGVIAVPSTLLVDAKGTVVAILEGYAYTTRFDFRDEVLRWLGALPPAAETPQAPARYRPKGVAERYYRMGVLFTKKRMPGRAAAAFRRALAEDPDYAEARARLEEFQEQSAPEGESRPAAAGGPSAPPPRSQDRGRAPRPEGPAAPEPAPVAPEPAPAPPRAARTLPAAPPQPPPSRPRPRNNAEKFVRMGTYLLERNLPEMALKAFRTAVQRDPRYPEAYEGLARALEALGRPGEAEAARTRAQALRPEGPGGTPR